MEDMENPNHWTEDLSRQFIDYGRYFVPEREGQMQRIVELLGDLKQGATILELCCGEGLLAELILKTYPSYSIQAYDGSPEMLARAQNRLANFKDRFQYQIFDLASDSWRVFPTPVDAVISSLAIHHLPGPQKQILFKDIHRNLTPGGILVIADVLEVVGPTGKKLAADEWDQAVRQRALDLDGDEKAFNFFKTEGWNMHRYLDPEDIDKPSPLFSQLKWLEEAGFTDIAVNWLFAGHAIFSARKSGSV
jgi:tRNA (cmo5U34)-methyltransferase